MSSRFGLNRTPRRRELLSVIAGLVALVLGTGCDRGSGNFLTDLTEARRLAADLRVQFSKAADASNRAVMADTDAASIAVARDAATAKRVVASDVAALRPLLQRRAYVAEARALDEFQHHFAEYEKVDGEILALAVENTNLKAQRLSFGPAREAADGFRAALEGVAQKVAAKDRCRVEALVGKAVLAVREIQVLQAPHIAERDDAPMTRMEREMAGLKANAESALTELRGIVDPGPGAPMAAAAEALTRFNGISDELVKLSRRNTNVRSLDLTLRVKPPSTEACDERLRAIQEALAKEQSQPSR